MWISWVSEFYLWTCTKSMDCWGEVWPVFLVFAWFLTPQILMCVSCRFSLKLDQFWDTRSWYISGWGFVQSRSPSASECWFSTFPWDGDAERERTYWINMIKLKSSGWFNDKNDVSICFYTLRNRYLSDPSTVAAGGLYLWVRPEATSRSKGWHQSGGDSRIAPSNMCW